MTLEIDYPEVDHLLQALIEVTGESEKEAIATSLKERLERLGPKLPKQVITARVLLRIGRECAALPLMDARPADDILGYDAIGLPS